MSQIFEELSRFLYVRCSDVGPDCNCVILEMTEKRVMDETIIYMFVNHAIIHEEMTSEMKSKIRGIYTCITIRCARKYYMIALMFLKNYYHLFESDMGARMPFSMAR